MIQKYKHTSKNLLIIIQNKNFIPNVFYVVEAVFVSIIRGSRGIVVVEFR